VETVDRGGRRLAIYDLSDCLSNDTSAFEFNPHRIEYLTPTNVFGLGPEYWPGGAALAAESVTLTSHSGTHVDAPAHYGPAAEGEAMTIDRLPLEWCFGPGIRLDLRHKDRVDGIWRRDVEEALERAGHELQPFDVVLVWTGTDLRTPGYQNASAGLRRDATEFLVDAGVRMIGIDAWGLDRPFDVMVDEAKRGRLAQVWESHLLGREKPYAQIERLANLDQLPTPTGYTVYAFPAKLENASAGWARVVAVVET
jgi:kynurenine formamidase